MSATHLTSRSGNTRSKAVDAPMPTFTWKGTDKRGTTLKGELQAKSEALLRAELRKQGITASQVRPKSKPLFGSSGKKISSKDISIFSRQLATMMKSGVPIVQSLEIIAGGQKNPKMGAMVNDLRAQISGGSSISEALAKYPIQFDTLYRSLVQAGEGAGVLETVLDTIANYQENTQALKGKIKKAMFYPAAVLAVALIVSIVLLVFVVPQFEEVFKGFGAELPAFTQMIVGLSRFMVAWWWLLALIIGGSVFAFIFALKRSVPMQRAMDRLMLKLPVVGKILHESAIARFARTLAITFAAGVPLVEALGTVAGATGNSLYENGVMRMRDDVAVGYQVNFAMKQINLFPNMVVQMTAIGEEAGALDTMLLKVAEFYEQEVDNAVDALTSLLEPFIIVILGGLVGSLVVGMYLPIFKLGSVVG